ncbi:hypothetical protein AKJ09_09238 [Labilithrix luteola]|uniref:TolB protein n=1 Tax=Labilithrix luteola TaxID=1391654 RepID=A0A0K1QAX8_9BACT|nr:hypothetical protein [Labilithrix luteola]AKV02575.1 hypothetical protein AKJ09_09238 [Labilithrix luteola]
MRASFLLLGSITFAGLAALAACGDASGESMFGNPKGSGDGGDGLSTCGFGCDSGTLQGDPLAIETMRIEPADGVLTVDPGKSASQTFKVFAKLKGFTSEQDITARSVFYVPDNYLVGTFPTDGSATFTTRLPATATDPPQRGGKLTVQAQAANGDGSITTVTTSLTVKLSPISMVQPGASPTIGNDAATKFTGTPNAARNPRIAYPNDGVMMPPNLRKLDVHWDAGSGNDLFELAFVGSNSTVTYYARCSGGAGYQAGKCGFELDQKAYAFIAATNNGGSVTLKIRGTDNAGVTYGESTPITMNFAESNVEGGLYYWAVITNVIGKIMRVDFGNPNATPEDFIVPPQSGLDGNVSCVGCHTLSRDGTKLVASVGGRWDGRLVYLNDLNKASTDPGWASQNGAPTGAPAQNRVQFASFDPTGAQFVAVYGDIGNVGKEAWIGANELLPKPSDMPTDMDPNTLFFHDGTTGLRASTKKLAFKPDHPDWSPDGQMIAVTHVGNAATAAQRPTRSGIDVLRKQGADWTPETLVAGQNGKNRVNPNFVPDSSFLLYTESTCPDSNPDGDDCDGDSDPSARTFAIKPAAGGSPVALANAGTVGVADGSATETGDTFPRSTPFVTKQNGGTLLWTTIASRRAPGYKTKGGAQLLWMFAIDPAKVLAGQDGSYTAFYLPFQDFGTSNHIGQWTEKIVGGNAPPPPPPPVPPPPPPPPK